MRDRRFIPIGAEFFELTNAPSQARGISLLDASCAMLEHVAVMMRESKDDANDLIPYVNFKLPDTPDLASWRADMWDALSGDAAWLIVDTNVFGWSEWESHHQTMRLPIDDYPRYHAIFRRFKGVTDGRPWDEYSNELYLFALPGALS